ncbi:hypothetical protein KKC1_13600 [Calderihabitans maritimus]|uniref:Uncharacterized protein n=1 Tax=Calderihabitans maritimus TaxID=1246530 RepID=A0A1Z5HRP8_9FIRM|nr:hypothetical protein KKC1_13600 [Calderihabitans maritimus]
MVFSFLLSGKAFSEADNADQVHQEPEDQ